MAFPTDGSSHHNGVANEKNTIDILNEKKIYPTIVEKRGGTKLKEDAVAGSKMLSIKQKKGITQGSFDWGNYSTYSYMFGSTLKEFVSKIKSLRKLPLDIRSEKKFVNSLKSEFKQICENALNDLTSEQITEIIQTGLLEAHQDFDIIVNDVKSKYIYKFNINDHPVSKYLNEGYVPTLIKVRGKVSTSRKIVFIKDGEQFNCGLRIRVVDSNGMNAWLGNNEGKNKKNNNSTVTTKLQQDNIAKLLEMANPDQIKY
jgi:hypothetical protein